MLLGLLLGGQSLRYRGQGAFPDRLVRIKAEPVQILIGGGAVVVTGVAIDIVAFGNIIAGDDQPQDQQKDDTAHKGTHQLSYQSQQSAGETFLGLFRGHLPGWLLLLGVVHFLLGDFLLQPLKQLVDGVGLVGALIADSPLAGGLVFVDNVVSGILVKVDTKGPWLPDILADKEPGDGLRRESLAFIPLPQLLNGQGLISAGAPYIFVGGTAAGADTFRVVDHTSAKFTFDLHDQASFPERHTPGSRLCILFKSS